MATHQSAAALASAPLPPPPPTPVPALVLAPPPAAASTGAPAVAINVPLHRKLTTKFVAMALLLFMAPQVFLFYFSSNTASEMLIESLRNDLKEKSFLVGADIDRLFNQRLHDVLVLSQADVFEGDDIDATIQYLTEVIEATPYLDDIDVIDIDGTVIASSGEQNEKGQNILQLFPSLRHIFVDLLIAKQGDMYVSEILKLDNGPGLAFLTPITDDANVNVIKVLLVEINLDTVKKIVADFNERVIGDKYVYLVDNDGRVIVSADPRTSLLSPFPDLKVNPALLDNFSEQGDVGSVIYQDATGEQVMAGFADMAEFGVNKAMDWSIIAVAPIKDITAPVAEFQNSLLALTASIFGVVAIVMFVTSRSIVAAVMKLVEGANRVGSGEIQFRINHPVNDEFGFLASTINVTLDRLVQSQRDAEQSNLSKSQFLAAMSHEIRTPMAGVVGMADLILDSDLSPQQLEWATSIKTSGKNLLIILNQILDQSKLEVGKLELSPADIHLKSLIEDTVGLFGPNIISKGLTLKVELDDDLPKGIHADRTRISQVLSNLLSNALKFTEVGRIAVHVELVRLDSDALMLKFTVSDSGIGLSKAAIDKLFTAFTQADSSTSRTYGGTGLGLSISKQLVKLMGGEIGVESAEKVGSAFWFTLPCQPANDTVEATDRRKSLDRWVASRPLKVLVAEDNLINQQLIHAILRKLNHRVTLAGNGKLAIECIEDDDFDIVLMDIRMPVMDGLQATASIRSMDTEKSTIPIIALTADISAGNIKEYTETGVNEVCGKPLDLPVLLKAINKLLGEEIHTSIAADSSVANDRQDTDTGDAAIDSTDFSQILVRVANLVDQRTEIEAGASPSTLFPNDLDEQVVADLVAQFVEGVVVHCSDLKAALARLIDNPHDDEARGSIGQMMHNLKGQGTTFGYHLITTIATDADALLNSDGAPGSGDVAALVNSVDAISLIATKRLSGHGGKSGRILLQGIRDFS